MKKLLCCLLILAVLCAPVALADIGTRLRVSRCDEYITLREAPSTSAAALARMPLGAKVDELYGVDDGFMCVCYQGKTGYALSKYLTEADNYEGETVDLTDKQRYNINLFLSNFTEAGFMLNGCYDESYEDNAALTVFGIEHCWFNRPNSVEWGEYFDGNNVRVSEDAISSVVKKYFGISRFKPDHSRVPHDYRKGYYYWQETGGNTKMGFACLHNVEKLGGGRYCVWFNIFDMGNDWDNDVCYYKTWEAEEAYPTDGFIPQGRAVIDVGSGGLGDRSDWKLVRYAVANDYE